LIGEPKRTRSVCGHGKTNETPRQEIERFAGALKQRTAENQLMRGTRYSLVVGRAMLRH